MQVLNVYLSPLRKLLFCHQNENTKFNQNKSIGFQPFVQFGVLEIWWHFIFFDLSARTHILKIIFPNLQTLNSLSFGEGRGEAFSFLCFISFPAGCPLNAFPVRNNNRNTFVGKFFTEHTHHFIVILFQGNNGMNMCRINSNSNANRLNFSKGRRILSASHRNRFVVGYNHRYA